MGGSMEGGENDNATEIAGDRVDTPTEKYMGDVNDKGERTGAGELHFPDQKCTYKGNFTRNLLSGKGVFEWEEVTYEGEFKANQRDGMGLLLWRCVRGHLPKQPDTAEAPTLSNQAIATRANLRPASAKVVVSTSTRMAMCIMATSKLVSAVAWAL